jgi:anaerobic selenocysteine-containing dehydrogenase
MVHAERDPLTGAMRDALFMAPSDIAALGMRDGDHVVVRSDHGELKARLHASELRAGNVQVFFPEGNVLLRAGRRDPASGVPDYNAIVTVEAAGR